jgi:site-specific recombinase XerD
MNQPIKEFNELIKNASEYLATQLSYSPSSVNKYRSVWKQIRRFMSTNGITRYDQSVEKQLLSHRFGERNLREFSVYEKECYNGVKMLTAFQQKGLIQLPERPRKAPLVFDGEIGQVMQDFLGYKKTEDRLSKIRLDCYQRHLFGFLTYCQGQQIESIQAIDLAVILRFIGQLNPNTTPVLLAISALRGFMKYVFEQKLSMVDYSGKIPRYQRVSQPRLPSTYSTTEIEKLIACQERSSATGKRNYAIILLAARLGLRASDICRLRFESLQWHTSTIHIRQYKTGRELILPLLAEVGNAIIDYLRYARPRSEEPFVFLSQRPPFGPFLSSNVVTHVVQRAFAKASLRTADRRFGPHALRHSLSNRMLQTRTALPVISQVLGHQSSESTRYYLRIDLESFKQCILEVPAVASTFYEQQGGAFYE